MMTNSYFAELPGLIEPHKQDRELIDLTQLLSSVQNNDKFFRKEGWGIINTE